MRWPVYSLTKQTSRRFGHERLTGFTQFALLVSVLTSIIVSPTFAQEPFKRLVRKFETRKLGIPNPTGLAFSPSANAFLVAPSPEATEMMIVTFAPDLQSRARIATAIPDPLNMVFDSRFNRLLFFDAGTKELVEVRAADKGVADFSQESINRFDARSFHLKNAQGLTLDPETGSLFFLAVPPAPASPRIVRVSPDLAGRFGDSVTDVVLSSLRGSHLRGIAFNSNDRRLYIMNPGEQKLYELTQGGEVLTERDLSSLGLGDAQNMVFAPSGDQTDAPDIMSLYIVSSNATSGQASGDITELSLTRSHVLNLAAATIQPTLVQTIQTSGWPSPDPSGAAYIPSLNRLFVSDGEVNEMTIFSGTNLWGATLSGNPRQEFNTTSFSDEPTGVAFNPSNGHLFITDDTGQRRVYEVDPGSGGDNMILVSSFKTSDFSSSDPEGIAYDTKRGHLYISDGGNNEIYRVNPGANGVFDGVAPTGDDIVSHFDTEALGVMDPEGVEFNTDNENLYIVGDKTSVEAIVVETTRNGDLVNVFDLAFLNVKNPAGIAYAPSSVNPGQRNLYILDRGVDNGSDPNENDGKIFEISFGQPAPPPSLSIDNVSVTEGNGGTTQAVFTLSLSSQSSETVEVDYQTGDGTATPGDDYTAVNGRASFDPGETSHKVTVEIRGDEVVEQDETFFVNLSNAAHADISDSRGRGTIQNDDSESPAPPPSLSIDNVSVTEGNGGTTQAVFTLSLSSQSSETVEVDYQTGDGTATPGDDYTAVNGRASFNPGETSHKVTVEIRGDEVVEQDETFFVNLSNAAHADISDNRGRGTIQNDDSDSDPPASPPSLSIDNVRVIEGTGGTTQAIFTLSLSDQSSETVEVDYETADGTATSGDDYTAMKGRASFDPGETSHKIAVEIRGDELVEPDETFFVNLSNASHADIGDGRGRGMIENDDSDSDPPASPPSLSIDNVRVKEGNEGTTHAVFTLSLSGAGREAVEVDYATNDGSATHDRDYVPMKGRARFEPGETGYKVTVDIMGDELPEQDETFFVNLSNAINANIENSRGSGTIENDDSEDPPARLPRISIDDVKVPEGNRGKVDAIFTLSLSAPSGETVKVSYETGGGSAKPESDYVPVKGQAVFRPGETRHEVTVAVLGDELVERDEVFMVHLRNAVNGEIADDLGKGTIEDDDERQRAIASRSFQDGVGDYNGTRDTELMLLLPNRNFGQDREMDIDGFPNRSVLLYWDLTAIPPGSKIESVDVTLNVTDASGQTYEFYRLLRPWNEREATWREYAAGKRWRSGGANSPSDRDSEVLGSLIGSKGSVTISLNSAGVEVVQSWVNKPESNHGFIIMDYRRTWNSLAFSSRESRVASHRPQLTVTYADVNQTDVASSSLSKPQGVEIPETVSLRPNYPNPFNLETRIEYDLPELSTVRLAVYNIRGQQVRLLVNEDQPAGLKSVTWSGRDDYDQEIGSGIYFVRLVVGQQTFVNRIILQK